MTAGSPQCENLYAVSYEMTVCLAKSYTVGGKEGKHEEVFCESCEHILLVIETLKQTWVYYIVLSLNSIVILEV